MRDNIGTSPFQEEKHASPLLLIAMIGAIFAGCCVIFIGAYFFFNPDQLSIVDKYFPSPAPTQTKTPIPTVTPNLTATQQVIRSTGTAQAIEAVATDSVSQWPVLFSDTFDSNKNDWPVGSYNDEFTDVSREIEGGKYTWDATAKQSFIAWVSPDAEAVTDFRLSVEIQRTSGSSQSDHGLIFREDDTSLFDDFYYFGIDDQGFFVLLSYGGEWLDMVEYTSSSAILPERSNRLTVIGEGSYFIFLINDQYVAEMTDDHLPKGISAIAIELYEADLQATFEFDNFELRTP